MDSRHFAVAAVLSLAFPVATHPRPLVLEQTAKITNPDLSFYFGFRSAVDGNDIIVTGSRYIEGPEPFTDTDDVVESTAFLYTRTNGQWNFITRLVTTQQNAFMEKPMAVAIKNGLAAITSGDGPIAVFERTPAGWVHAPSSGNGDATTDVEIEDGAIMISAGAGSFGGTVFRKNASGVWTPVSGVQGPYRTPDGEQSAGDVDLWGNRLIVGGFDENNNRGEAHIFSGAPSSYVRTAILKNHTGGDASFASRVALERNTALVTGNDVVPGTYVFQNQGGVWNSEPVLRPIDAFARGDLYPVDLDGGVAVVGYPWDDADRGSVCVFQRDTDGVYQHAATLVLTDQQDGFGRASDVKIRGRTAVVQALNSVFVYEIPTNLSQPDSVHDDFEDGNSVGWAPIAGSAFTVVSSGGTRVLRQSSLTSAAGATLTEDRKNQSIQADIRPTAFAGADHWFGLTVRQTDESNYYYVTLRQSNTIQLKKMVNGVYQTLASAPFNMQLNRLYRVQLEAVGTAIRAHVDGNLLVEARDASLTHGNAGLRMYRARADHDNIVISSGPRTQLFADDFQQGTLRRWTAGGDSAWAIATQDFSQSMQQNSLVGGARAVTGVTTEDQIIEARAKALSFASGGERWFGLMARYVDEDNYYYLTVRNNHTISLRRLTNGVINVLDSAAMTVTPNTWYTLRLEAVANGLRAYVNGALVLEASDLSPISRGRYGAVMYKATAAYDDVTVFQP